MASKLKVQEVILQSPDGLSEETVKIDNDGNSTFVKAEIVGLKLWKGTQAEYDAIGTKDSLTVYIIV